MGIVFIFAGFSFVQKKFEKNATQDIGFFEICKYGSPDEIKLALNNGADLYMTDEEDKTPLMLAVSNNENIEATKILIEAGADVNAKNKYGTTALMCTKKPKVIGTLIQAGADVNAQNIYGETALMLCNDSVEAIKALISAGADLNIKTREGSTALNLAVADYSQNPKFELLENIKTLLMAGAEVNIRERNGSTALMIASKYSSDPVLINILIGSGAYMNSRDNEGHTAIMLAACYNQNPEVTYALAKSGAKDLADKSGRTALMYAVYADNPEIVRTLIKYKFNINARDKNGVSVLGITNESRSSKHKLEIMTILLDAGAEE